MEYCDPKSPNDMNHNWGYHYPSNGFDYRQCRNPHCARYQNIVDKNTFYDPESNQYVDSRGCHNVSDLVGYEV